MRGRRAGIDSTTVEPRVRDQTLGFPATPHRAGSALAPLPRITDDNLLPFENES